MSEQKAPSAKDRLKDYGVAVLATVPSSLMTSVAKVPTKIVEGAIEPKVQAYVDKKPQPALTSVLKPATRRALGSLGSAAAIGALTFPLYTKAIDQLSSDSAAERRKGAGLLIGQGLLFSAIKGAGEAYGEAGKAGRGAALKKYRSKMIATGLIGMPALYLTSKALASQRRKERNQQDTAGKENMQSIARSVLRPALVAGGVSAAAGAAESVADYLGDVPKGRRLSSAKSLFSRAGMKLVAPKAVAYGAGGALSGIAGKLIIDKAISSLNNREKKFKKLQSGVSDTISKVKKEP